MIKQGEIKIENFTMKFNMKDFDTEFGNYLNKAKDFSTNYMKKSYNDYQDLIQNQSSLVWNNITVLEKDIRRLFEIKPELEDILTHFTNFENSLSQFGHRKIDEGDSSYFIGNKNENGKKTGKGVYNSKDQIIFAGEFENDFFKRGILIRKVDTQNTIYIGHFKKDKESFLFNGCVFIPFDPVNDPKSKQLSLIFGQIRDDKWIEGILAFSYPIKKNLILDCEIISGSFKDYKKSGKCLMLSLANNSSIYYGQFLENKPNEKCYLFLKDTYLIKSRCYQGTLTDFSALFLILQNGIFNGETNWIEEKNSINISLGNKGRIMHDNNDIYDGDFCNGLKHNKGSYFIRDSESLNLKYSFENANFQNDKIMGTCQIFKFSNNDKRVLYEGIFDENNEIKNGEYFYNDKEKYKGDFEKFMRNGNGEYLYGDGSKIIGSWKENKKDGENNYLDKDGSEMRKIKFEMDKPIFGSI